MKQERTIEELYARDPERADAEAFGRKPGLDRRGFLGGAGLAAMSAAVGGDREVHCPQQRKHSGGEQTAGQVGLAPGRGWQNPFALR